MSNHDKPRISAIICTYNPRLDYLERALQAVARQTLDTNGVEILIVDNNSSPPIDENWVMQQTGADARLMREPRQGVAFARISGVRATTAPLICFVDDDNEIEPNYFAEALKIAAAEPALGAFGGVAAGELERPASAGFEHFLPFLGVKDEGDVPLTSASEPHGPWEPIGAGMCLRRDIAIAFADFLEPLMDRAKLGRAGTALLAGEDSLVTRIALHLGYSIGYRPALRLTHMIRKERLSLRYLAPLLEGFGRSKAVLETLSGSPPAFLPKRPGLALCLNFLRRLKAHGPMRAYGHCFFDRGLFDQAREIKKAAPLPTLDAIAKPNTDV